MLIPVSLPPGVFANGTTEQAQGRFSDSSNARWTQSGGSALLTQMRGWAKRDASQTALVGKPRACVAWQDNAGDRWIAVATNSKIYVQSGATTVSNITPSSYTAGPADASVLTGFGVGGFGVGTFGTPRPDAGGIIAAAMPTLDLWNDKLVSCLAGDGKIVQWDGNPAHVMAAVTNAPTGQQALLVTAEGFLMAFKNRTVTHSDRLDNTIWTASDTNQARNYDLQTSGVILCGAKPSGVNLILTTTDIWTATYIGYPSVYSYKRAGSGCGGVSRGCLVAVDQQAVWLGREGFFLYNGFVQPLPCEISDQVFGDINLEQLTKVTSGHRAATGEVWWNYCSAGSTEIDRQAIWNYRLGCWYPNDIARSCMADSGAFTTPIMVSPDGYIYAHETGFYYDGATPWAETGPFRAGQGQRRMEVQRIIPDERTTGDVQMIFYPRDFPNSPDGDAITIEDLTSPTDLLFQAGRFRIRYEFVGDSQATVGDFQLDIIAGDPLI